MLLSVGKLKSPRRIIAATGGGGGGGAADALGARSGTADSDHVHTLSSLNTLFMIPDIHYISQNIGDNTENYSVKDILFTSGSNASHTFYLAVKSKSNTSSFHNDLCVGVIQIHTADAIVKVFGPNFGGFTTIGNVTEQDPTGLTFGAMGTSSGSGVKWHIRSSTNSANTGAADGITGVGAGGFQNLSNPLPNAGENIVPQDIGTDYMGTESSGSTINKFMYLKFSASLATSTAHRFVFAYNFGVAPADTFDDKDDNVGLYIQN